MVDTQATRMEIPSRRKLMDTPRANTYVIFVYDEEVNFYAVGELFMHAVVLRQTPYGMNTQFTTIAEHSTWFYQFP